MITVTISSLSLIVAWLVNAALAFKYGWFFLAAIVAFRRTMSNLTGQAMSVVYEYQRFQNDRRH